jgi:hypothetical protein
MHLFEDPRVDPCEDRHMDSHMDLQLCSTNINVVEYLHRNDKCFISQKKCF